MTEKPMKKSRSAFSRTICSMLQNDFPEEIREEVLEGAVKHWKEKRTERPYGSVTKNYEYALMETVNYLLNESHKLQVKYKLSAFDEDKQEF